MKKLFLICLIGLFLFSCEEKPMSYISINAYRKGYGQIYSPYEKMIAPQGDSLIFQTSHPLFVGSIEMEYVDSLQNRQEILNLFGYTPTGIPAQSFVNEGFSTTQEEKEFKITIQANRTGKKRVYSVRLCSRSNPMWTQELYFFQDSFPNSQKQ